MTTRIENEVAQQNRMESAQRDFPSKPNLPLLSQAGGSNPIKIALCNLLISRQ